MAITFSQSVHCSSLLVSTNGKHEQQPSLSHLEKHVRSLEASVAMTIGKSRLKRVRSISDFSFSLDDQLINAKQCLSRGDDSMVHYLHARKVEIFCSYKLILGVIKEIGCRLEMECSQKLKFVRD